MSTSAQSMIGTGRMESEPAVARFIAILSCYNNLTLNAGGRLTCEGDTMVQPGYVADIIIELQKSNGWGGWDTIKTWSGADLDYVSLYQDWYVEHGTYRLKLTHRALTGSWSVVETFENYSKTVTY